MNKQISSHKKIISSKSGGFHFAKTSTGLHFYNDNYYKIYKEVNGKKFKNYKEIIFLPRNTVDEVFDGIAYHICMCIIDHE